MKNYHKLVRKCAEQGLAVIDVPADGNCMVWSLMVHYTGKYSTLRFELPKAHTNMKLIRDDIAKGWVTLTEFPLWQKLFGWFCEDRIPEEEPPSTPKKKDKKAQAVPEKTPSPVRKKKQKVAERVDGAHPIPFTQKHRPVSPRLMEPQREKKRGAALEPDAPELEEQFHDFMQGTTDQPDVNSADVNDVSESMLQPEKTRARKRVEHERTCKRKTISQTESQTKAVENYLASLGITYTRTFISVHREDAIIKKGAQCRFGGWTVLKKKLIEGAEIECPSCKRMLAEYKVTLESVAAALRPEENPKPPKAETPPRKQRKQIRDAEDGAGEYEKFLDYVKQFQGIVLVHGGYKCTLCVTKTQPTGKMNRIPPNAKTFKSLRFFVDSHIESPTHCSNLAKLKAPEAVCDTKCPGLSVSDCKECSLHFYLAEFKLWCTYTNLMSKLTKHSYWRDLNEDKWFVRSNVCKKMFSKEASSASCCSECLALGNPRRLQRQVVRFVAKFYTAHLLSKRLFFTEQEVADFVEDLSAGAFARNNKQLWTSFLQAPNHELQVFVRRSWHSVPGEPGQRSEILNMFLSSVVHPCLKVHTSAVSSNLAALSTRFLDALAANSGSATWLWDASGCFGNVWDLLMLASWPKVLIL